MTLHWIIAALILSNILLAWNFHWPRSHVRHVLIAVHETFGLTVLALAIVRLVWRLMNPPPPFDRGVRPWERGLAFLVHASFYGFMILMPLSGWMVASAWSPPQPLFWWGAPMPYFPWLPYADLHSSQNAALAVHKRLSYGFYLLFLLHLCAALKHQFWDHLDELGRMIPFYPKATGTE